MHTINYDGGSPPLHSQSPREAWVQPKLLLMQRLIGIVISFHSLCDATVLASCSQHKDDPPVSTATACQTME